MNVSFGDFFAHMQWIEIILVPNDRSSLDLHFGILHVILVDYVVFWLFLATHGLTVSCIVPASFAC